MANLEHHFFTEARMINSQPRVEKTVLVEIFHTEPNLIIYFRGKRKRQPSWLNQFQTAALLQSWVYRIS